MKLCVLASGSSGNSVFVSSGGTRILVDAGLSARNTERKLCEIGVALSDIQAICLTHEHTDHTVGLDMLTRRHAIPVYANRGTADALTARGKATGAMWKIFTTGAPFDIGDVRMEPFSVPHDAYEPVGYVAHGKTPAGSDTRIGIVTDMGMATELIRQRLKTCQALVLEANHDETLLQNALRPWSLKQRISGRQGHFSNTQALALLAEIAHPALRAVFLAHLSSDCNTPEHALNCVRDGLRARGHAHIAIEPTYPREISRLFELV